MRVNLTSYLNKLKITEMKTTNPLQLLNVKQLLITDTEALIVSEVDAFKIKGVETLSPVGFSYHLLSQPKLMTHLAHYIADGIKSHNKTSEGICQIKVIAGNNYLAQRVAEILKFEFLPILDGDCLTLLLDDQEEIAYVADVIATGKNTTEGIEIIARRNKPVEKIFSIFDYCLNFSSKLMRKTTVYSLLNIHDIKDLKNVSEWMKKNGNLFREMKEDELNPSLKGNLQFIEVSG